MPARHCPRPGVDLHPRPGRRLRRPRHGPDQPEGELKFALYLTIDRVRFAGIWDYVWPSGVGPRVAEPAFLLIDPYPWSAPYEELRLKQ